MTSSHITGPMRHFLQFQDFTSEEILYVLKRALLIKEKFKRYEPHMPLHDRTLAMVFEKASTRTRVSFEAGMYQLGGSVINLTSGDSQLGRSEPIEDTARVISRMVDIVMIRTFEQTRLERFAAHSRVPVINGLTNEFHPCQILADLLTFFEHRGPIEGKTVAWIGDANNMAYTWIQAAKMLNFTLHVSAPKGYQLDHKRLGNISENTLKEFDDPVEACKGAHLITTDVWTSMGFEDENEKRRIAFADWCVDDDMMKVAAEDAIFMHCLPAHRGEEVTAEVIDGPQSVVWDEAENRLHAQKALMEFLLLGKDPKQ
ncbi:MAG: ornithine carbamoyltransferase [Advenella sp.]